MECKQWTHGNNRQTYIDFCKLACEDEGIFQKLKSMKEYSMVEKPTPAYKICGEWLLNVYIQKYKQHLNLLEIGISNDKYLQLNARWRIIFE